MKNILSLFCFAIVALLSCKKYLDKKPDKSFQTPSTISDLQALLDHGDLLNGQYGVSFDESSADNYYLTSDVYSQQTEENRNTYLWKNFTYNNYPNDWGYLYRIINISNVILDNIDKVERDTQNQTAWNNVKGSALFLRSYSFLQGALIFCNAYDESTAPQDLGMALRLTSDFNLPSKRSSLEETYEKIITDLKEAIPLLPDLPQHVLRPSRSATYALLARTYLSMRKYDSCLKYADLSLEIKNDLMDYNDIDLSASYSFSRFNKEVIFDNKSASPIYVTASPSYAIVDTLLYKSYAENDLRKFAFFKTKATGYVFKGSYSRSLLNIGLVTDEIYLMKAECYARAGNKDAALNDLNTLMITRWKSGSFNPFAAATPEEALKIILTERRKELIFRNLRWMDIKRLNKEGANISLTRVIDGQTYTLPPNDKRFALPLPADIINMTGMIQNPY